jgi:hypothetical protein
MEGGASRLEMRQCLAREEQHQSRMHSILMVHARKPNDPPLPQPAVRDRNIAFYAAQRLRQSPP